jgi:hypothetical protein
VDAFIIDDAAWDDTFKSPDGPVGQLIAELSAQVASVARSAVRVRTSRAGKNSTARAPGFTKSSIAVHGPFIGEAGSLYGGANAAADPAIFLEQPASQMHSKYPFLTTGLDSLQDEF